MRPPLRSWLSAYQGSAGRSLSERRERSSTLPVSPCHHARSLVESAASGMNTPDRNSKPANSRTVLVVDDDVLVRMPVVQFLRDCGYRVVEAASTDEAIVILQKTNIPVDVVLSEIDIPGSMN